MSEFIGSRISLVSKSDIRYVGTLHEIDSVSSTVALENVTSYGTEGRKGSANEEIPPSDQVYEYIVFRGSDVKDLRIEEAPAAKENKPPQPPNDPAILGAARPSSSQPPAPRQGSANAQNQGPPQGPPQQWGQHPQYPPNFYPPPPGQWGRGGPGGPLPPNYSMPPYGAPPGWMNQGMPPQGFPPGQFPPYPPYGFPPGPPPGQGTPGQEQDQQQQKPAPIGPGSKQSGPAGSAVKKDDEAASSGKTAAKTASSSSATTAPVEKKAISATPAAQNTAPAATKPAPSNPKNGRVMPAVPLPTVPGTKAPLQSNAGSASKTSTSQAAAANRAAVDDQTAAATAAVAAAMASLPPVSGQANGNSNVDNLTKKVGEMRASANDTIRAPRQPSGSAGFGGRGRGRGGRNQEARKVDVPTTDFDFESSNAKFNKDDLVKEAIAGSPLGETPAEDVGAVEEKPTTSYNKKSSFFDDLSSEQKDRAEGSSQRPGGREWRGEEQKKNLETFGQGSVDNGYGRGGYRGRGRGRGGRGRGYGGNGQPRTGGGFSGARNNDAFA